MIIKETTRYRVEQLDSGKYVATISGTQFGSPSELGLDIVIDDTSAEKLQARIDAMIKGANNDIRYRSLAPRAKQAALF